MTFVLLDTNAYLRLAKRIKPLLGKEFGQKKYVLTILKDVEDEVLNNPRLKFHYPWFEENEGIKEERLAKRFRFSIDQKGKMDVVTSILKRHAEENAVQYTSKGRSPPSSTDCRCLAFGQIRPAVVVTDDLGMHKLSSDFEIKVWHGHELLKKMLSAKLIDKEKVREIYDALEFNDDLTKSWRDAKDTAFKKVFR